MIDKLTSKTQEAIGEARNDALLKNSPTIEPAHLFVALLKDGSKVFAVQPQGCDIIRNIFVEHALQGIAVGIKPPILREAIIDDWFSCPEYEAFNAQDWLLKKHGIFAGASSGANIHIARHIMEMYPDSVVVTFVYDSGESYE